MDNLKYLIFFVGIIFATESCDDNFLIRLPLDAISEEEFWNSPDELEAYVNYFYPQAFNDGGIWNAVYAQDVNTDNMIRSEYSKTLAGTRTVPSSGGLKYDMIRKINYFLNNYDKIEQNDNFILEDYQQFVGEAFFFKAYFYFDLLKSYGDIPYYDVVLGMESDELYNPRTDRQVVVDHILESLDKAIKYMKSGKNEGGTRLSKDVALLFKSRVALYEGSWEKYHDGTNFGVSDPKYDDYFRIVVEATESLMKNEELRLFLGDGVMNSYMELFNQLDYSGNPEILLWEQYSEKYGQERMHYHQNSLKVEAGGFGYTKDFIESFLCIDGLPISISPLYSGDNTLENVIQNRDPRLSQILWTKGDPMTIDQVGDTVKIFDKPILEGEGQSVTGYQTKKGVQLYLSHFSSDAGTLNTIGTIYFRYAECLLNNAEAHAELGSIDQYVIDNTINKLRDRVGMPHLDIGNITYDPNWSFPDLDPVINEIRRERRIELIGEGFRYDDLFRWRAHEVFLNKRPRGFKFNSNDYPNLDKDSDVLLDENDYIDPYKLSLSSGYAFNPDRDYLMPISIEELTLNPNLNQNPGW